MGGERRQRSIAVVGVLAAITGLSGVSAATSVGGDRPTFSRTAVASPASASPTTTTTTTVDEPAAVAPTSTTTSSTPVPPPATTTTTLYCHNSSDPRCGPFRWDPDPGPNQPLTVALSYEPKIVHVGDPVVFHLVASDPDAEIVHRVMRFSDAPEPTLAPAAYCTARYGPWTPPAPSPDREAFDETHVYSAPGVFTVNAYAWSMDASVGADTCHDPYASGGEPWTVNVVVQQATGQ